MCTVTEGQAGDKGSKERFRIPWGSHETFPLAHLSVSVASSGSADQQQEERRNRVVVVG